MSSLSMLSVLANEHKGTLAGKCIDARLAQLKSAEEAKRKSEAEASTKAEAERHRLVLLQQQERERAEAEATRKRADAADAKDVEIVGTTTERRAMPTKDPLRPIHPGKSCARNSWSRLG
jgi:hypothetical protein